MFVGILYYEYILTENKYETFVIFLVLISFSRSIMQIHLYSLCLIEIFALNLHKTSETATSPANVHIK